MAVGGFGAPVGGVPRVDVAVKTYAFGSESKITVVQDELDKITDAYNAILHDIILHIEDVHVAVARGGHATPGAAFDTPMDPKVWVNPQQKSYIYINAQGQKITGDLDAVGQGTVRHDQIAEQITLMTRALVKANAIGVSSMPRSLYHSASPRVHFASRGLFTYFSDTSKTAFPMDDFIEEALKHIDNDTVRDNVRKQLKEETGEIHSNMLAKAETLLEAGRTRANTIAPGFLKDTVVAAATGADLNAAKLIMVLKHIIASEMDRIDGRMAEIQRQLADVAVVGPVGDPRRIPLDQEHERLRHARTQVVHNVREGLARLIEEKRDAYQDRGWVGKPTIEDEQKAQEDGFISNIMEIVTSRESFESPQSAEEIFVVGPMLEMTRITGALGDTTARRAGLVRLDKLVGHATEEQYHAMVASGLNIAQGSLYDPEPGHGVVGGARPIADVIADAPGRTTDPHGVGAARDLFGAED